MKGLELKEMTKNGNNNHAEWDEKGQKLIDSAKRLSTY